MEWCQWYVALDDVNDFGEDGVDGKDSVDGVDGEVGVHEEDGVDGVDGGDGVDGHRPPLFDVVENAHNEYGGRHKEKKENHQDLVSII